LLRTYAPHFVNIGVMYESYINSVAASRVDPEAIPNDAELVETVKVFKGLNRLCSDVKMEVSARILSRTVRELSTERRPFRVIQQRMTEWYSCFQSELDSQLVFFVYPHRSQYYSEECGPGVRAGDLAGSFLELLMGVFPNAVYDIREAGKCLAYGSFTACAYHLMRATEYGLVACIDTLNLPPEKKVSWDRMIQAIEGEIKKWESTKPTGWDDRKKAYADFCAWFTTIKNGWRNPVSHIPRIYSETTVASMFGATRTLFEHLIRNDIRQVQMPSEIDVCERTPGKM
jgi:hypothetical protein